MRKKRLLMHIVGNRPQFIKLAPVLRALGPERKRVRNVIVHSGQHYDYEMAQIFFDDLELPAPDYNLNVGSGTHSEQTGLTMMRLDPVLEAERPDAVLVYGDTNTTLAGSLAAHKKHIPLAHVESGLRERVWRPEEINRKLSDDCADFLFCPTKTAVENLRLEGVPAERIHHTGDVTYDAFLWSMENIVKPKYAARLEPGYILTTLHRAETVDHRELLSDVIAALCGLKERVVFPVHPRTMKALKKFGLARVLRGSPHVLLSPAVGYYEFLGLLAGSKGVITDSGGVIKEAFYAQKPCVTIDSTTEYVEIRESGANIWSGKKKKDILRAFRTLQKADLSGIKPAEIFGDGRAAQKMAAIILRSLDRD